MPYAQHDLSRIHGQGDIGPHREAEAESAHKSAELEAFLKKEIKAKIEERDLFKPQESVRQIAVLSAPLTFEDGFLTRTMKVRRHVVADHYNREIEGMFQ